MNLLLMYMESPCNEHVIHVHGHNEGDSGRFGAMDAFNKGTIKV